MPASCAGDITSAWPGNAAAIEFARVGRLYVYDPSSLGAAAAVEDEDEEVILLPVLADAETAGGGIWAPLFWAPFSIPAFPSSGSPCLAGGIMQKLSIKGLLPVHLRVDAEEPLHI